MLRRLWSRYVSRWNQSLGEWIARRETRNSDSRRRPSRLALEGLEDRVTPSTSVALLGGDVVVTAGAGQNDNLTVSRDANNNIRFSDPGQTLIPSGGAVGAGADVVVALASITGSIFVNTNDGNDRLTINYATGNIDRPISYDGGAAGADSLRSLGGAFSTGTYSGTALFTGTGTVNYFGQPTISFTNIEPFDDLNTVTTYTINATPGNNDTINVSPGPVVLGVQTMTVSEGGVAFEQVNFANKTTVIVNALDGTDTFNVDANANVPGLVTLDLYGHSDTNIGDDNLADTFFINTNFAGDTVRANGGGGDDSITVGNGLLSNLPGAVVVRGQNGNGDSVFVNDSTTAVAADFNLTSTTLTRVLAGFGGLTYDDTIENLQLDTGSGANVVTATSLAAETNYFVNTSANNDTLVLDFTSGNPPLTATMTYDGGGQLAGGADTLSIVLGTFQTHTYTFVSTDGSGHTGSIQLDQDAPGIGLSPFLINFSGLEPIINTGIANNVFFNLPVDSDVAVLEDDGAAGNTRLRLRSTAVVPTFDQTDFVNPRQSLTINGGDGGDLITVFPTAAVADFTASLTIDGQGGTDTVTIANNLALGSATAVGNLTLTAETINLDAATIRTDNVANAGSITLTGPTFLGANVAIDTDGSNTDGAITFNSSVDSGTNFSLRTLSLGSGAGTVTLQSVGQTGNRQLGNLTVNTSGLPSGLVLLNGNISTDRGMGGVPNGNIDFSNATGGVRLNTDVTFNTDANLGGDGGNLILAGSPVNAAATAAQGITIHTGSGTTLLGVLGNTTPLAFVNYLNISFPLVTPTGLVTLNGNITTDQVGGSGDVNFDAATGGIRLGNSITINTDASLAGVGGNLDLSGSPLNGTAAATQGLTIRTGDGTVDLPLIGATTALAHLIFLSTTGLTTLNGNISTDVTPGSGLVDFSGATGGVQLNTTLTINTDANGGGVGGALNLNTAVNAANATIQGLTLNAGNGAITLGNFGQTRELGFLTVSTSGLTTLNGNIATDEGPFSGDINFAGATGGIRLGNDVTINSDATNGGASGLVNLNVAINGTTAGQEGLTIRSSDGDNTDSVILGTVGAATPLEFLTVVSAFAGSITRTTLNGNISTDNNVGTGNVTLANLAGGVRLGNNIIINTDAAGSGSGGAVSFDNTNINATTAGVQTMTIQAANAAVTLENVGTTTSLGGLTISPAGSIDVQGSVVTAGNVVMNAQNAVTVNNIDAGAGTIEIRANQDGAGAQSFVQNSGTIQTTNATANAIRIFVNTAAGGTGDATILALSAPTGTVTISADDGVVDADGGAITDGNGAALNVTASNLILNSRTGFSLNTAVATLTANNTGTGAGFIAETDDITLTSVVNQDGTIFVFSAGNVVATLVRTTNDVTTNDITIQANGNITAATITAGAGVAADVALLADIDGNGSGSVLDDNNNATRVTGDLLQLIGQDIGQDPALVGNGQIDTAANIIIAVSNNNAAGSHGIWIGELDAVTISNASTTDGVIDISAGGTMNAVNVVASGTGRNVRIITTAGNIVAQNIQALGDTVFLNAAGSIIDGNVGTDIQATNLLLNASTGIGASNALETVVTNLAYNAGVGGLELANTGALNIVTVTAFGTTIIGGAGTGPAVTIISAASPMTVNNDVIMGGNITLTAGEISDAGVWADDLTIGDGVAPNVLVRSTGGSVTLRAGDEVWIRSDATIQAATSVTILPAFGDLDGQGNLIWDGTIIAGTDVAICVPNNLSVGTLTAGGTVTLRAVAGAITDGNGAAMNITAASLAMLAATGIATVGDPLETTVGRLEAQTGTGGIFLVNTGALNIGGVTPDAACGFPGSFDGVRATTSGDISLVNAGSIIFDGTSTERLATTLGNVLVQANGATANVETRANSTNTIDSDAGNVTITAGQDILLGSAATDRFGDIQANGAMLLTAGRDIIIDEVTFVDVFGAGNTLTANAGRNIALLASDGTTGSRITSQSGVIQLTAAGTFTSSANGLGVDSTIGSGGANIIISGTSISLGDPVTAGAGNVTLTATTGSITDTTLGSNRVAGANLTATAVTGILLETNVGTVTAATTSGAGAIDLRELDGVTLTNVVAANGPITITAGGTTNVTNVVSTTDSDANDVSITTSAGDLNITTVTAGAGALGDVTLQATTGNIVDDSVNATLVTGDVVSMTAFRAIGQPGAIAQMDTSAISISAVTTGPGVFVGAPSPGIWIGEMNGLILTNASTGDGVIVIDAGIAAAGLFDAQNVVAGGIGRSIRLRSLNGDLHAGSITAVDDIVNLSATGAITDDDAANDVTANGLRLSAGAGIGSPADPLETTVSNLTYNSGTGSIDLVNAGGLTLTNSVTFIDAAQALAGTGNGHATITATSPLTVAANVVMGGTITLTAGEIADFPVCADDFTLNAGVTIQSTGGNIFLRAGDDVLLSAGSFVISFGSLEIAAGFNDLDACGGLTLNGTLIFNGDLNLCSFDPINILAPINAGVFTVRLQANGTITQNAIGTITAGALGARSIAGNVDLDNATNNIATTFAASAVAGSVAFHNSGAFSTGQVTALNCFSQTVNGVSAATTAFLQNDGGTMTIGSGVANTGITAGATVGLNSGGNITQSVNGPIVAPNQVIQSAGTVLLCVVANDANNLAISANNTIEYRDSDDLTIATITVNETTLAGTFNGLSTNNADVNVQTGTSLTINDTISVGGADVRLVTGAAITQNAAGVVTADELGILAGGTVTLCVAVNDVNSLAVSANGTIEFQDSDNLTIDAVNASGNCGFTGFVGLASNGGDINLLTASTLTFTQGANAGAGTIRLQVTGGATSITQGGAGVLTAASLSLQGANIIDLDNAPNAIATTLAGTSAAGVLYFRNANGFTTGQVAGAGCVPATVTGINAPTAILNADAGTITVGTGVAGTGITTPAGAGINAAGGITQTAQGIVTAPLLILQSSGPITLCAAVNDVNTLAASTTGLVEFRDGDDLAIGMVSVNSTAFTATINGVISNGGDINLNTGTSLIVNEPLNAGIGNVRIVAGTTVNQIGTGIVTANELGIQAGSTVTLCAAVNDVNTLAINNTGLVEFFDVDDLIVGAVAAGGNCGFTGATGIASNNNDINLQTGTSLTVNAAVNAGSADVRLVNGTGISQNASGVISADELGIRAGGSVALGAAANNVSVLAATTTAGSIQFRDSNGFTVGTVLTSGNCGFITVIGISTVNADISLCADAGPLTLTQAVNAGNQTVRLQAGSSITQSATGVITASALGAHVTGAGFIDLDTAVNDVDTLAARTDVANNRIEFLDSDGFATGQVAAAICFSTTVTGVTTNDGPITLVANTGNITAGTAGIADSGIRAIGFSGNAIVRLQATTGNVSQVAEGRITSTRLGIRAGGSVNLTAAANDNDVIAIASNGLIEYRDAGAVTIQDVSASAGFTPGVTGITSGGNNINLQLGGSLTLNDNTNGPATINAGAGDVRIVAGAGVTQTGADDFIIADELGIRAGGAVLFCVSALNDVNVLAVATNGLVEFRDADDLTIGTVAAGGTAGFLVTAGISSTNNNVNLQTGTTLAVNAVLNAGGADVRLVTGGAITQTAAGVITADELGIQAGGAIGLAAAASDVNTFAATAPAAISFTDSDDLTIGTVGAGGNCGFTGVSGVVATGAGNITITTVDSAAGGQNLTIQAVNVLTSAGDISLCAGDDFTMQTGSVVQATGNVLIQGDCNNADPGTGAFILIDGTINNTGSATVLGNSDNDIFILNRKGFGPITLDGLAGSDDYFVQLGNLAGIVTVNDTGNSAGDILKVNGTATDETFTITNAAVATTTETVNYAGLETLNVFGLDGTDTFNVRSTNTATTTNLTGDVGNDVFNVSSDAPTNAGNLDGIQGPLNIEAGIGAENRLTVSDMAGAANANVLVTANQITGFAPAVITYQAINGSFARFGGNDGIRLIGSNTGNDTFTVTSTLGGSTTQIEGLDGADTFNVGSTPGDNNGDLDNIVGRLTIIGGNPGPFGSIPCNADPTGTRDYLYVNDRGNPNVQDYFIDGNSITASPVTPRVFAGLFYDGTMDYVRLDGTDKGNIFDVTPSLTTQFFIDGNLPPSGVCATPPVDYLRLNTIGTTGRHLNIESVGKGDWTFTSGHQDVCFDSIEKFNHVDILAVANDKGLPIVRVYDAETLEFRFQVRAYENFFRGGVRVATGDVNCDGLPDLVVTPGAGRAPTMKIYNGAPNAQGQLLSQFNVYPPQMKNRGVYVAIGDVNGDGANDVIVGADGGWLPQVRVFNGMKLFSSHTLVVPAFNAFDPTFRGGVRVAAGDLNGDGKAEIIVGSGFGVSTVRVFDGARLTRGRKEKSLVNSFFPFGPSFKSGVFVAAGDINGDGRYDIIASADKGWVPLVTVFDGSTTGPGSTPRLLAKFRGFAPSERTGIRVAAKSTNSDGPGRLDRQELFLGSGPLGGDVSRRVRKVTFNGLTPTVVDALFENTIVNGKFVYDGIYVG